MARKINGVDELARAKWLSSGLTADHAKRLKLKALSAEETEALGGNFKAAGSLLIPYFTLAGKPTDFYRIRYLEPLPGFAGQVEKPQRYAQPKGTVNEVYLPPILQMPWEEIAKDVNVTIYITEGELKAACACANGLATLGLGGVDVWRSTKRGVAMLPALQEIKWDNRPIVIVYDSDAAINMNVLRAQRQLAKALLDRGARPAVASLPPTKEGGKQGLDDFLVANGKEALDEILNDAPAFPEADALWEMNSEVVYVRDPGIVIERKSQHRIDPHQFRSHVYANRHFPETVIKNGVPTLKQQPLAKRWLEWPRRAEVQHVSYLPGKPLLVDGTWNTWQGWGCEPAQGDVSPWIRLLDYVFASDPASRKWFEQWCAYPIQNPGAKMYTAALLWSVETGTGKTLLAYMLGGIYGKNFIEIKSKDLKGGFNAWGENKQFIYGDEITGGQARVDADWLKGLISQKDVRINAKFMPEYVVPDCMNYLFSSNHPDAIFMEDRDRRYFVHEIRGQPMPRAFYEECDRWLKGSGPSHLFYHLLRVDLTGFNPRERAPETAAKKNMIMAGKSDIAAWCVGLKEDPATALKPLGEKVAHECALYTPSILLRAYDHDGSKKVTAGGLARELMRAGFRQLNGASPIRTKAGLVRLYAVRDLAKWEPKSPKEMAEHFEKYLGPDAGKY